MVDRMTVYGRDESEWDRLTEVGHAFLIERARMGRVTSYTELNTTLVNRTGLRPFDFSRPDERAAMGHLLGLIVERDQPKSNCMISALVNYLDENDAGPGFYAFAQQLGLLSSRASPQEKEMFWVSQVAAVHSFYGRASP